MGFAFRDLGDELKGFFGLEDFSLPRWRSKSKLISMEDSSSVSFAEEMFVQAVAELPLLSEEQGERPSPRKSEEPSSRPMGPSVTFHFLLFPFEVAK